MYFVADSEFKCAKKMSIDIQLWSVNDEHFEGRLMGGVGWTPEWNLQSQQ